jgi:hypothetical protein
MPIHVEIRANEQVVQHLHIARLGNKLHRTVGAVNRYAAVFGPEPITYAEWEAGTVFTHAYGDGVETLVQRALNAIEAVEPPTSRELQLEAELAAANKRIQTLKDERDALAAQRHTWKTDQLQRKN